MDEIKKQLADSIRSQIQSGRSEADIKRDVLAQGWSENEFAQVLATAKANIQPVPPKIPESASLIKNPGQTPSDSPASYADSPSTLANTLYSLGSVALIAGIAAAIYFIFLKN